MATREEWVRIGLSTDRADRARAEAGVRTAYGAAGLAPPRFIVWLDSPMAGAIGSSILGGAERGGSIPWEAIWGRDWGSVWDRDWRQVWRQIWEQIGNQLAGKVEMSAGEGGWRRLWCEDDNRAGAFVRWNVWDEAQGLATDQLCERIEADALDDAWLGVARPVGTRVWDEVGVLVRTEIFEQFTVQVRVGEVRRAWDHVGPRTKRGVTHKLWDQAWIEVWHRVFVALNGQHDVAIQAYCAHFRGHCDPSIAADLFGMDEIARSCGWWWPYENLAVLTERPVEIHLDDRGRLHNANGAALLYPDGWGVWAINGIRVPRRVIERPETLTFEQVRDEPDAEVRRHMLDRFAGLRGQAACAAWIKAGRLEPISTQDITHKMQPSGLALWRAARGEASVTCRLYQAPMADDEPLAILIVVCTSTAKEVPLRVPPTARTAAEARAWTFGRDLAEAFET
ncbi:MAG TPA: hypothetical protein VFC47_15560 [Caulobacteraceae bacterium]|nr:hypothetical protein [Caulobacteraceae bacterium]